MAKRPSDLSAPGVETALWVIEVDAPDGAVTITETEKMTIAEIVALGSASIPSWVNISLLNGWTGTAKYRVFTDGEDYLEIFLNVSPGSASSDTLGTLTGAAVPDWIIRRYYSYISAANSYLQIDTGGNISINEVQGAPINITENFKVIVNTP